MTLDDGEMDAPVLPRRPLRLQDGFVRSMRQRAAFGIVTALVAMLVGASPARDLVIAWELEWAWERAEPLEVVAVDFDHARFFGVPHAVTTTVVHRDETGERVAPAERFRTLWVPSDDGPPSARRVPETGRVLTSIGVASRPQRIATAALALLVFAGCALGLLTLSWRRLRALTLAREAAARSEEIGLVLVKRPRWGRYVFEAPSRDAPHAGYRDSARRSRISISVRARTDEPLPMLLGEARALGLRIEDGRVLVLRDGLWPLALSMEEQAEVRARLQKREAQSLAGSSLT